MNRKTNIFDKIGTLVPGYKGYQEREGRRECDRQLREEIANKLSLIEKKITDSIDNANFEILTTIENTRKKINNLNDLIKYSPYGESSLFADSVIKENELDSIYQLDLQVLENTENIQNNINSLSFEELKEKIIILEDSINQRNQFLKDL